MCKYTLTDNFKNLKSQVATVNFNHHFKGEIFHSSFLSTDICCELFPVAGFVIAPLLVRHLYNEEAREMW